MTEDARQAAVRQVLAENGATAPETDLDTLASRVVAALDNTAPAQPAETETPDDGTNADHTATP